MKNLPYLLTTILLAVLPWYWIPKGFVYTSEEPNFINYDIKLEKASTMWTKDYGFGYVGEPSNQSLLIPNAVFYRTAKIMGFNGSDTQKLFLSFIFLSISLGFYYFSTLFSNSSLIQSSGLLTYLFNFYLIASLGYTAKSLQLVLMPAIFFVTYKYLKTKKFEYILQSYLWLYVFQGIFTNLPLAATTILIYFVALFYYLLSNEDRSVTVMRAFLLIMMSLLPILLYHFIIYWHVLINVREEPGNYTFTAIGVPLSLVFQLRGAWWEKSGHAGVHYFNLWSYYGHPLLVALTSTTVIAVIFSSVRATWGKVSDLKIRSAFWLFFYLLSLGLASGYYFLPGFFQWLVDNVPLMVMFREPWAKFIPLVVFSFSAITMVALEFFRRHDYRKYILLSLVLLGYLMFQSYPFISGKIIDSEAIGWKRRLIQIPNYWEEYSNWTKENQYVILAMPFGSDPFNSLYNWHGNGIGNSILPMPCVLGMTNVICNNNLDKYTGILKSFVDKKSLDFLKLGGVDMILTQDDLEITADQGQFGWQVESAKELAISVPVATFGGKIRLYRLKDQYIRPKMYATGNVLMVDKNERANVLPITKLGDRGIFIFSNNQVPEIKNRIPPETSFLKVSQTEYVATIEDATDPFVLVLNEAYNQGWRLFARGQTDPPHLVVNGFANGWFINPKEFCTDFPCEISLKIEFGPQKYFSFSLYANMVLFCVALVSLLIIAIIKAFQRK